MRKIATLVTAFVALLAPLWFLPLSPNPIGYQKQYLLLATGVIFFVLWVLESLRSRRILFSFTPITIGATAIALTTLLSAALAVNPVQQIFGRAMLPWSMFLVILFGTTLQVELRWAKLLRLLLWTSALLSLFTWLQFTPWNLAVLINSLFGTNFASTLAFTLAESPLAYLSFILPVSIAGLLTWKELSPEHQPKNKALAVLSNPLAWVGINFATVAAMVVAMMRDATIRPILLPFQFGWGIAVENFKAVRTLLIGVGPESFLMAFHRFRDVTYNTHELWSTRFSTNSSELLHTLSTTGLLGLLAWVAFLGSILIAAKLLWNEQRSLAVFLALQAAIFVLLPMSALGYFILTLSVLALTAELRRRHPQTLKDVILLLSAIRIVPHGDIKSLKSQTPFTLIFLGLSSLIMALTVFMAGRVYASQVAYTLSLHAAARNDVTKTYQLQQAAVRLNPSSTAHHRAYASTNLAIARSIAQRDDLGDQERQLFAQLLQQAIREARTAAQLVPQETENWETLSSIYSNLLNVEGARDWATAGLVQAIQTDPISPQLRTNLGSLYLTLEQPDEALRLFEQAIQLKPDWSIGYLGYGRALSAKQQWNLATQAYQRALQLSEEGSEEYVAIQRLLGEAGEQAAKSQAPAPEENNVPAPEQPTVPSQPQQENLPSEFGELVGEPAQNPQPSPTPDNGNIVLPEDVGF